MDHPQSLTLHLSIPAVVEMFPLARMVATWAASHADLTIDDIDDVAIAVEEALIGVLDHGADRIGIDVAIEGDEVIATVTTDADVASWPPASLVTGLGRTVLDGVTDELAIGDDGTVRFTKRANRA